MYKEHKYVWFMVGDMKYLKDIKHYMNSRGWAIIVSLNMSYYKEHKYI